VRVSGSAFVIAKIIILNIKTRMLFNICEKVNNRKNESAERPDKQFRRKNIHHNPVAFRYLPKWRSGIPVNGIKTLASLSVCCEKNF
jgi:hypothetical protein